MLHPCPNFGPTFQTKRNGRIQPKKDHQSWKKRSYIKYWTSTPKPPPPWSSTWTLTKTDVSTLFTKQSLFRFCNHLPKSPQDLHNRPPPYPSKVHRPLRVSIRFWWTSFLRCKYLSCNMSNVQWMYIFSFFFLYEIMLIPLFTGMYHLKAKDELSRKVILKNKSDLNWKTVALLLRKEKKFSVLHKRSQSCLFLYGSTLHYPKIM